MLIGFKFPYSSHHSINELTNHYKYLIDMESIYRSQQCDFPVCLISIYTGHFISCILTYSNDHGSNI